MMRYHRKDAQNKGSTAEQDYIRNHKGVVKGSISKNQTPLEKERA